MQVLQSKANLIFMTILINFYQAWSYWILLINFLDISLKQCLFLYYFLTEGFTVYLTIVILKLIAVFIAFAKLDLCRAQMQQNLLVIHMFVELF